MTAYTECLFIEIRQNSKPSILIGCVLRPLGADIALFNFKIVEVLAVLDIKKGNFTFILGDFNLDLLKYQDNSQIDEFLNDMLSHSYFPTIRHPTRITDSSATLLDNIFTNCIENFSESANVLSDISDHLPVGIRVDVNPIKNNFHSRRKTCSFKV